MKMAAHQRRHFCWGVPYARVAIATPVMVKASAPICVTPRGSPSEIADAITPTTGTSIVPIAAVEAGNSDNAPNQQANPMQT
jgi:hypothetical protein